MKLEVQYEANLNPLEHLNAVVLEELLPAPPQMPFHLHHYLEPLEADLEVEQGDQLEAGHLQQFHKQLHHNKRNELIGHHPKLNQQPKTRSVF